MPRLILCGCLAATALLAETVDGRVINAVTGAGVAGVHVSFLQSGAIVYSGTTDSQGRFRIDAVRQGTYSANYWAEASYLFPVF